MSKMTSVSLIALTALSLTLAGCQKKAEGQVVAIVNGEEITLNELNDEISTLNVPPGADRKDVRAQVLSRMFDRRLLAQAAKAAGLDRDPSYISQERRMKEQLLVTLYGRKALDTIDVPDTAKVDAYMAAHPTMFKDRVRYTLDQLVFDLPSNKDVTKEMADEHSLTEIAATLTKAGIPFQHGSGQLDSATISGDAASKIRDLPAGEPFIARQGNKIVASVVTHVEPVALPVDQARPLAVQAMRTQELESIGEERLKEAKDKAKIEYQPGYEPPASAKTAAATSAMTEAAKNTDAIGAQAPKNAAAPAADH